MVNEERLHHMIKMAIFDTDEGKQCKPMIQYARKDYVAMRMLGSFVSGTIGFALIFATWALYSMDQIMRDLNTMDILGFITSVLTKYFIFMLFYMGVTYIVYNNRYTRGRREVKKYYNELKKLNRIYEREDKLKLSENKEWD